MHKYPRIGDYVLFFIRDDLTPAHKEYGYIADIKVGKTAKHKPVVTFYISSSALKTGDYENCANRTWEITIRKDTYKYRKLTVIR